MKLILFDFDGTLTYKDSFVEFIQFTHGKFRFYLGLLLIAPKLIAWRYGWITAQDGKVMVLKHFYKNKTQEQLENWGKAFCKTVVPKILFKEAMPTIQNYQKAGEDIAVVSASLDVWIAPFCDAVGMELICTKIAYDNGIFKGKLASKNCNFKEKVQRIKARYDLSKYDEIIAYGNSKGDKAMLDLADVAYFRVFKSR